MPKSIMTILFSLALGLVIDHLNGAYLFSQAYGSLVSGLAFLALFFICSSFYSSVVYKVRLGQAFDRFLAPYGTDTLKLLVNLPMTIMFIAFTSGAIDHFLWVALSIAIGDLYYFKYRPQQAEEA